MKKLLRKFSGWAIGGLLLLSGANLYSQEAVSQEQGLPVIPSAVKVWEPEGLGNHRAVVQVDTAGEILWARIAWRRIDPLPELKGIVVANAQTGSIVGNVMEVQIKPEFGDIFFEARETGKYYVYYMPYRQVKREWNPFPDYFTTPPASHSWLAKCEKAAQDVLDGKTPEGVGRAAALMLEANGEANVFTEMEIPATDAEREEFLATVQTENIIFFQEPVSQPIKMTEKLPIAWTRKDRTTRCEVTGAAGEHRVFQLGAVSPRKDLSGLQMGCIGLKNSEGVLKPEIVVRCYQLGGNDFQGAPLLTDVSLKAGEVLPLWMDVDIPEGTAPGVYTGELIFSGWNLRHTPLPIELEVLENSEEKIPFEKLHWLNSTAGVGEKLPGNFPPIKHEANKVTINHHALELSESGLPVQVGKDLLALPVEFRVKTEGKWLEWAYLPMEFNSVNETELDWTALCYAQGIVLNITARAEGDGFIEMRMELSSRREREIEAAELIFAFDEKSVPYFMGLGVRGGKRPNFVEWEWSKNANQFFWIGNIENGLYCKLLDREEKQDIYFMPEPYQDWCGTESNGRIDLRTQEGRVNLVVQTGAMKLLPDEERVFRMNMMLTPLGRRSQQVAAQRVYAGAIGQYFSDPKSESTAERVVVGYDSKINPYLNAPFLSEESLRDSVQKIHADKKEAHLVFGTREIPTQVEEFWPMWMMNHEIFTYAAALKGAQKMYGSAYAREPIPYIGTPWLCEHFGEGYSASWLSTSSEGQEIVTLKVNPLSRWQNYYLESLRSMIQGMKIDGLRSDLTDRRITKRLRRVLDEKGGKVFWDSVTGNNFRPENGMANPMAQYLEHLSMLDEIVFADGFSYESGPDYYLVELSGAPFGVNTHFQCNHPWKSLLYGVLPQMLKPDQGLKELWDFCDLFQMGESKFTGYWEADCPVASTHPDVYGSAYQHLNAALLVYQNWGSTPCELVVGRADVEKLGLDPALVEIVLPGIDGLQRGSRGGQMLTLNLAAGSGAMVLIQPKN